MSLVTSDMLKKYMSGVNMSSYQAESVQDTLDGIQAELELFLNRPLEARLIREVSRTNADGFAYLSVTPVIAISKITQAQALFDGTGVVPAAPLGLDPLEPHDMPGYDLVPDNFGRDLIVDGGIMTGFNSSYAVVEYVGGGGDFIAPHLPAIILGICRVAAREFKRQHDDSVRVRSLTGETVTETIPMPKGWTPGELDRYARLRRRVVI